MLLALSGNSGFCAIRQLEVSLLPAEWDDILSQHYPWHIVTGAQYRHVNTLVGGRECEVKTKGAFFLEPF